MKKAALVALVLAVGLSWSVDGYTADKDKAERKERAAWRAEKHHVDSDKLMGTKVQGRDGKALGEIDHLIVNMSDDKVSHAVIALGGAVGIGERQVVVPWDRLKFGRDDRNNLIVTMDRAALEAAPRYVADRDRDRGAPAASPATQDRDRDGVRDRGDRAPSNPNKQ